MSSHKKAFKACGVTAQLFELILSMSEQEKEALFAKIGNRRNYKRIPYLMQVTCETDSECFQDFILDLSPGGIFLETVKDLPVGQHVTLIMNFRNEPEPVSAKGLVAWKGVNGVGIQFSFDTREEENRMEALVAGLE